MSLAKYFTFGRLRPVATGLPRRLAQAFGSSERYTVGQVKRAISDLKLREDIAPYALAAACSLEDLEEADAGLSAERYQELRTELADLFDLPADFTMMHLRRTRRSAGGAAAGAGLASSAGWSGWSGWFAGRDYGGSGDGGGSDGGGGGDDS